MAGRLTVIEALALLLACQLAGEALTAWSALPVPGPVLGMVLLLGLLAVLGRVPAELDTVAQTLLRHLSLLFVPAAVGVVVHLDRIETEWKPIVAALVASTVVTIAVTAAVFRLVARLTGDGGESDAS